MGSQIHLIKLSVGSESVETLIEWQDNPRAQGPDGLPRHVTRMWPRREADLKGSSIYWVIKGFVQARQRILRLDEVIREDGIRRCGIVLEPALIRTVAAPKRPFQGWRYLQPDDAPIDLPAHRASEEELPKDLELALADLGLK